MRSSDHLKWDVFSNKRWEIMLRLNTQHHLGQSEDWLVCVLLAMCTCNVWCDMLPRICQSIGCHIKHSVDTLMIMVVHFSTGEDNWRARGDHCPVDPRAGRQGSSDGRHGSGLTGFQWYWGMGKLWLSPSYLGLELYSSRFIPLHCWPVTRFTGYWAMFIYIHVYGMVKNLNIEV